MRSWAGKYLTAVVLLALSSGLALAKGGEDDGGTFGHPPALVDLGIWTLVVFILLLVILRRYAWGPILQGLQKRETDIQQARDEAVQASEDAKKAKAELEAQLAKANQEAQKIVDEARADATKTADDIVEKARKETQAERDRLLREIETAKDQALHEIWTKAANLATEVSSRTIRRQLSTEDHRRLIDEALAELKETAS